jgi:hypothetical protein
MLVGSTPEGEAMPLLAPASRPGRAGSEPVVARSRHELLLHMRTVVLHVAPEWRAEGYATILLTSASLGRADVQAAFDEIHEKCHVEGVELSVDEHDGRLRATLTRARV